MYLTVTSGVLVAALLWATESIALELKRPASLPALDFSCYLSHTVTFTTLDSAGSELGIGGDNHGKSLYRFTTVGESMLKVVEFPDFYAMRKDYEKAISELSFDNAGNDSIFGWSEKEAMGIRIFVINQRDRIVSLLEIPPGSQTVPFGTLQVLKCNDSSTAAPPTQSQETATWPESAKGASPMVNRALWRASKATFPKHLPIRAQRSPRSNSQAPVFKAPPIIPSTTAWSR
jgi:hypothetical protein